MDIDIFQLPGILRRRKLYVIAPILVCVMAAAAYVAVMKPTYSSTAEVLLDPAALMAENADRNSALASPAQDQSNLDSQIYIVTARDTLYEVVHKLDLTADPYFAGKKPFPTSEAAEAAVAGALKEHLKVARVGQSLILTITAQHTDAHKAADVANAVADAYLQQVNSARADASRRAGAAFQVQASELRDRVLKAELAVEKFRSDNGLVSTGERGLVVDQQLAAINDQLVSARVAEEQQRTIYEQAQKLDMAAIQAGAIPEVLQSLTMNQLRDRYTQLLDRQTQLSATLGSGHPQLQAIRSQVANMQQAIGQELNRIRQSVKASYDRASANTKALANRLGDLTKSSFDSDEAQIKMRQLESEADAVRALYKSFLSRAEELGQQQTVNTSNSRVITSAVASGGASSVLKLMIIAAAALFGTAAGCTLAVAREILARLFTRPAEEQQLDADLPLLSTIPTAEQTGGPLGAALFRLSPRERKGREVESRHQLAILRAAEATLEGLQHGLPASVAFIATIDDHRASTIVSDIVQALVQCGQEVLYAHELQPRRRPRPGLRDNRDRRTTRGGRGSDELPLGDILEFERLTVSGRSRYVMRPTFSRFLERSRDAESEAVIIVNGCTSATLPHRQAVLRACDAIVIISGGDGPGRSEIAAIEKMAGDGQDRLLGLILVEG